MEEVYDRYAISDINNSFIIDLYDNKDFSIHPYLDMFHLYPYGYENCKMRSDYYEDCYTEGEYYQVLKQLYDEGNYEDFEYLAKLLEFVDCKFINSEFEPYIILNKLNQNKE